MQVNPEIPQRALDDLPVNIAVLDTEGTIIWTSRSWRTFGAENNIDGLPGAVGSNYLESAAVDEEHAQAAKEGLEEVLAADRAEFSLEYPCHGPETKRWFLMWAGGFIFEDEQYATVAHFDITERVLAEQELEAYADETSRQRDQLALLNQLVRHDIRNDIQLVMSHAELLRDAVPPDKRDHVENVLEQANHIVELTEAVKELEQAITADAEPVLSPINLGAVLQAEADKVVSTYETAAQSVTIHGADDVCYGTEVLANEMLSSVFGNILSNAVIHTNTDDIEIDISVEYADETVTVSIADTGPGIPEADWEDVFGRGEMGPDSPGTGLGLYLVDNLVDIYGGEVWIESNEPRGTIFFVTLQKV